MLNNSDRRRDQQRALAVQEALRLASLFGYDRGIEHLKEAGVPDAVSKLVLLTRYDRRKGSNPQCAPI